MGLGLRHHGLGSLPLLLLASACVRDPLTPASLPEPSSRPASQNSGPLVGKKGFPRNNHARPFLYCLGLLSSSNARVEGLQETERLQSPRDSPCGPLQKSPPPCLRVLRPLAKITTHQATPVDLRLSDIILIKIP